MFTVIVIEKGGAQKRFEFDEELVSVGRVQGNHIVLQRGNVSKRHAKIELRDGGFVVSDGGSTNGTYVNGRRIYEATRLLKGDRVYIGDFILTTLPPPQDQGSPGLVSRQAAANEDGEDATERVPIRPKPILPRTPRSPVKSPAPREDEQVSIVVEEPRLPVRPVAQRLHGIALPASKPAASPLPRPAKAAEAGDMEVNQTLVGATAEMVSLVDTILDQASRQVKRVSRTQGPAKVDSGTAGKIRIVIDELVEELVSRGRISSGIDPGELKGKALRAAVHMGPLSGWLDDPEVRMIRAIHPDSCHLLRSDGWTEAATGFVSQEEMAEVARCLSAGLEVRNGGAPGIARFRLEEGYLVFSALPPGAPHGPAIVIDKTAATNGPEHTTPVATKKVLMPIIADALAHRARIGVVGSSRLARLSVISELFHLLPKESFCLTVEDLPLFVPTARTMIRLSVRSRRMEGDEGSSFGSLLFHALELEPSWLVVTGGEWRDIPHVLSASAGRSAVLAELPLGGGQRLDAELAVAVAAAGISLSADNAATLLEGAFDVIITVGRDGKGAAVIERAVSCSVGNDGRWSPKSLFVRGETH
ncbi:MAG: FHA domain-containing protein [Myxococcota bacterium]|nr:FHA domain-containing protein [Myxococcota bacterium]